ncbi:RNA-directed DNA polymerase, eukaryota, reverse transcriptase zinc-binding domain protein [Tanacetum coccineum]
MWIVVYAPQDLAGKIILWSSLDHLVDNWDGILVTMGDFNEVRAAEERFGSCFNERQATLFNSFITNSSLIDVSLGGLILEKGHPDHRPILLNDHVVDFGPIPFRFYHSWLDLEGFHNLVVDTWRNDGIVHANGLISFKKKLQNLKYAIREWISTRRIKAHNLKKDHSQRLAHIDLMIDQDGEWIDDPNYIKADFVDHFSKCFVHTNGHPPSLERDMPNTISSDQCQFLERNVSKDEIKRSVWDCGSDRAPGPDGFTFKFFTTFWDLIEEDVYRFVQEFFNSGNFPNACNSSFIALIPKVSNSKLVSDFRPISLIGCQYKIIGKILANRLSMVIGSCVSPEQSAFIKGRNILDGPLILNEVMAWFRKRKKQLMIFKVDFEKAFDSVRWDFLDVVIDKLGFSSKWRFWIKGCLHNARASILVNGSPTVEFEISRGLRQGDPLSPFLFILAMEGLHSLICKATHLGIYTGTHVGDNNLIVATMAKTLGCEASKLPFKYLGVPVGCNMARCHNWDAIVQKFSSKLLHWNARLLSVGGRLSLIKAVLGNLPTYYMSLYKMPVTIYNKLESMRSQFFIGGDQGSKKMAWTRWNTCMASKQKGGLGIGSINALNVGLLFKWLWRFLSQSSDLWISVIKEIHGFHGDIFDSSSYSSCLSP